MSVTDLFDPVVAERLQAEDYAKCFSSDPPLYKLPNWFLDQGQVLRATFDERQNVSMKLNHSKVSQNLRVRVMLEGTIRPIVGFFALRTIEPGEELLFDYDCTDEKLLERFPWLLT